MIPPANKSCRPKLTAGKINKLMDVAAGRRPAEKMLRHVDLVNVNTAQVEKDVSLAIEGDRIAAVGRDLEALAGDRTEIMDGRGLVCLPGLIEPHIHLDSIFTVRAFARLALLSGNTTQMTETAMIAGAAGIEGVYAFMAEASNLPLRVFFLAPPLVPPFPRLETSAGLSFEEFKTLLRRTDVIGVGEIYWRPAFDQGPETSRRLALARNLDKIMEGHAAGAKGLNLQACRAGGISSCHEAINMEEALERLRLGMAVIIREGYIRSELPALAPLAKMKGLDTRRLILCTDVPSPEMLLETGVLTELIRRAVGYGFDPIQAVQMATLNPADYFGLHDLGRLDPGALADLILVDDLYKLNVETVMVGGRVAAHRGLLAVDIPDFDYPRSLYQTFKLKKLNLGDLVLKAPTGPVKVRCIRPVNETITKEEIVEITAKRGRLNSDPEKDLCKIAHFNKHSATPQGSLGLARGLGLKTGAVACSLIWDNNNLFVAGASDREMVLAANRVLKLQGGIVVVQGNQVLAELPLPVGGVISEMPYPEIMARVAAVEKAVESLGSRLTRPFVTFQTFCFTGLPFLRLTDKGLVDIRRGELVGLRV